MHACGKPNWRLSRLDGWMNERTDGLRMLHLIIIITIIIIIIIIIILK